MRGAYEKLFYLAKEAHKKNGRVDSGDLSALRELYEACREFSLSLKEANKQTVIKNTLLINFPRQWQWLNLALMLTAEEIDEEFAKALS